MSEKLKISDPDVPNHGYFQLGDENLGAKKRGDLKEGIDFAREYSAEERSSTPYNSTHSKMLKLQNKWPQYPAGFKGTTLRYFDSMTNLATQITRAIAVALGCPWNFFDSKINASLSVLRVLHYPPQKFNDEENLGAGAHTDYGLVTILAQDRSGLQVRSRSGTWVHAPVIPGSFIVNIGDVVQRLSNDCFLSTPHRVVSDPEHHRYSLPFFFDPNFDAIMEPLPQFVTATNTARHGRVVYGEHLSNMLALTYKQKSYSNSVSS